MAFLGCSNPMPFFPYPGIIARLMARFALPVVLALRLFLSDGFRIPIFIVILDLEPAINNG